MIKRSKMSLEDTENAIKNKLMDLIDEELSALTLHCASKSNENIYLKDNYPKENEENVDKESFSSSSDKTAELLKETDNCENEECKVCETSNSPSENIVQSLRVTSYQDQETELNHQEKAVNLENEKSKERFSQTIGDYPLDKLCMNNVENFTPPSDSLADKIRQRVEFYFEDYNLFKNSFLLSHIQRNKKGYVSLKLVSSMRKVKPFARDIRVVAYSLRNSKVLEFNPENNKVRRIEPIPKVEDTNFGKTLMVFNLPLQNLTPDNLRDLFSKFGTVVSAGIYEIESHTNNAYHQRCLNFHRKIASKIYGIVEFEKYEHVVNALKDEEGHLPKENQVKVVPLLPQIYKKEKKYLKYLEPYNPNPRRGYERYRPRDDQYIARSESSINGDIMRNEKMGIRGGYSYKRGYFRRSYRGRKPFMPPSMKSFADDQMPKQWNQPPHFRGGMAKKWGENRQLRTNNSFNIDRTYPDMFRKRAGNGYVSNGIPS